MDLLDKRTEGTRLGELQRNAINGILPSAADRLVAIEECGVIIRDTEHVNPQGRFAAEESTARMLLHDVVGAFREKSPAARMKCGDRRREIGSDGPTTRVVR